MDHPNPTQGCGCEPGLTVGKVKFVGCYILKRSFILEVNFWNSELLINIIAVLGVVISYIFNSNNYMSVEFLIPVAIF